MDKAKVFDRTVTAIVTCCALILFTNLIYSDIYFLRNSEDFPYEGHILAGILIFFFLFLISIKKLRLIFTGQPLEKTEPENSNFWVNFSRTFIGITLLDVVEDKSRMLSHSGLNGNVDIDAVTMDIITLWIFGIAFYVLFHLLWTYLGKKIKANKQQSL